MIIHHRWKIIVGVVVLVGGEPGVPGSVEQPLAKRDLGGRSRRVAVHVNPESGLVVQEKMAEDERL